MYEPRAPDAHHLAERRHHQSKPQRIGKKAGGEQEGTADEHQRSVSQLTAGKSPPTHLFPDLVEDTETLPANQ